MSHKYVLDTHTLIWYLEGNPRLGSQAKSVMDDVSKEFVLPIIALAEAGYIVEHKRTLIPDIDTLLADVLADKRIEVYSLDTELLKRSFDLSKIPEMHDRLIVATGLQVQSEGYTVSLLTKDQTIAEAAVIPITW